MTRFHWLHWVLGGFISILLDFRRQRVRVQPILLRRLEERLSTEQEGEIPLRTVLNLHPRICRFAMAKDSQILPQQFQGSQMTGITLAMIYGRLSCEEWPGCTASVGHWSLARKFKLWIWSTSLSSIKNLPKESNGLTLSFEKRMFNDHWALFMKQNSLNSDSGNPNHHQRNSRQSSRLSVRLLAPLICEVFQRFPLKVRLPRTQTSTNDRHRPMERVTTKTDKIDLLFRFLLFFPMESLTETARRCLFTFHRSTPKSPSACEWLSNEFQISFRNLVIQFTSIWVGESLF